MWTWCDSKEKLTEHLQKRKAIYQKHLVDLYTLREFFPSVDKKIYNVRIRRAVEDLPELSCYESNRGLFAVTDRELDYNDNTVITFSEKILDDETGKRIDNEKIQDQLTKQIQEKRKAIAAIDQDLIDGWERFQELLKIKKYYNQLYTQFGRDSQTMLERDCTIKDTDLWRRMN